MDGSYSWPWIAWEEGIKSAWLPFTRGRLHHRPRPEGGGRREEAGCCDQPRDYTACAVSGWEPGRLEGNGPG